MPDAFLRAPQGFMHPKAAMARDPSGWTNGISREAAWAGKAHLIALGRKFGRGNIAAARPMRHAWRVNRLHGMERLRHWARRIKRDVIALWLATSDPRVPWYAKLVASAVAAYALSPIDLIPDFIPVLGYLDDLLLVPLGILLAVRLIPKDVMADLRAKAASERRPNSRSGMIAILLIWLSGAALAIWLLGPSGSMG